ncbi:MAG: heme exporter protein CcmB [Acidimicrobiia bacterium]|nr:heme exporter protein CcmB [Acidimicrobiia bacterium]MBT8215017.1 heme exporter protein CcmB [Acidimicrobiia bacterium]
MFWAQARTIARRDLVRELRSGEVLWITIPFGAVGMLLIPLAIGTDAPLLSRIGPGMFWVVVLLFGILVAVRKTAIETPEQRDHLALLGIDPAARFAGRVIASSVLLLTFEIIVGIVAVALYDPALTDAWWLIVIVPMVAAGLALLGTLSGSIAAASGVGTVLVPLLVAPLAVPLLLAASQALEGLQQDRSILTAVLLMALVICITAIAGVLAARPLQETR